MKFICPLIVVEDIQKSKKIYQNILQQKVKFDFGENVSFEGDFAIHQKDHYLGLLGEKVNSILAKSNNFELYFETENLQEIYTNLINHGVEFIHDIKTQPWGQKVIRFYDLDDHIIEIGETMDAVILRFNQQGYSIDEIVHKSSMPIEFVQKVLQTL